MPKILQLKTRVVLGVTGSVAAYKAVELARALIKRGCQVRVVLTDSASKFVTPFMFETITGNKVVTSFWNETDAGSIGHIELADWAQVLVIAPASADLLAKLRYGFAESPLLAVALATKAPIVVAPAMNVNMFSHPATQENLRALRARGVDIIEPDSGELACGWKGKGRLAKPQEICWRVRKAVSAQDLAGKMVLITAGPTREAIDPVRFLSNRSSGKMGIALAREAFLRGASVTLVHGPLGRSPQVPSGVKCVAVTTAQEMFDAVVARTERAQCDIAILAAAVADYRPSSPAVQKLKKSSDSPQLELAPTRDILKALGERRILGAGPRLIGFAVETGSVQDLLAEARRKLSSKKADMIVGNLAQDSFDKDTNRVWIVGRGGREEAVATASKAAVARRILDAVVSSEVVSCLQDPVQH